MSWTSGGITLTADAWYANDNSFGAAKLGWFTLGLGVCNGNEDSWNGTCASPEHAVDNGQYSDFEYDFVPFRFSAPVDLLSARLTVLGCDGHGWSTDADCITSGPQDNTYDIDAAWFRGNGVTTNVGVFAQQHARWVPRSADLI